MKKAIKIIIIVFVVLLAGIISIPFLFKDKILNIVKTEINNNINAKVDFKNFDLTIFSSFPNLTLSLDNLYVAGIDEFSGDTLAAIKNTKVTVDIMSVISGDKIEVRSIGLTEGSLHFIILENGKANWDIAKSEDTTNTEGASSSQFHVALKNYFLKNCNVIYNDAQLKFDMAMLGLNHGGKGDFTQELFTLRTQTDIQTLTASYEGINYINKAKTILIADLEMDMLRSKYSFLQNELKLNELALGFDGFVSMPGNDIDMDLKFDVKQNEFKNFISVIPGVYREGFDKVQSSGKLAFNGFVKGRYSEVTMPGFSINLNISDGNFKYPDLPTDLNNVSVDLKIGNPDGVPDHTIIDLQKLHFELGKDPFDAKMIVKTPVSDADINASAKGKIDLSSISKLVPFEEGTTLSGILNADVTAIGRMSAIDEKRYQDFKANGTINLTAFNYKSNEFPQGISIPVCELIFNPKNVTLNKFDMVSGKTDIHATGWLDNLIAYSFKENELLKGTLDIKSRQIDLNEMMGQSSATATDTTPMQVFEVPENIDFLITSSVSKIIYTDLEIENLKGNIAIRDRTLGINDVTFNLIGGKIEMDGLYESKNIKQPFFYFDLNVSQMDIRNTYNKFIAVQKLAPIAEKCSGVYAASFGIKGNLDSKMEPVYPTLTGGGKFSTSSVTIENFEPLIKVADALKMDQFKKMNVQNVNLSFKFLDGRINIEPFKANLAGVNSTIEGSNGFDQTIDYNIAMAIPVSMMGSSATNTITGLLAKANKEAGTNLSLGKEANVDLRITGTVTDPKVETGWKDAGKNAVADVKEQIKEQFDQKKKELEDQAKAEADKLKSEAEAKAKAEADKLKKEAEAKAKAEADKLKKEAEEKLKKESENAIKDLFGKPKK